MLMVKNGVPWEVAMAMDSYELLAHCVIFGTLDGGKFNWRNMEWEKPNG